MKKLLLATVAATALLSSGVAFAGDFDNGGQWRHAFQHDPLLVAAVAADAQIAVVGGSNVQGSVGTTEASNTTNKVDVSSKSSIKDNKSVSASNNFSNKSVFAAAHGGYDRSFFGSSGGGSVVVAGNSTTDNSKFNASNDFSASQSSNFSDSFSHSWISISDPAFSVDSNKIDGSGNQGSGIAMINQNAGANSALQTNTTIAATLGSSADALLNGAAAVDAQVAFAHGCNEEYNAVNANSISGSFNGTSGVVEVNQNTGANSVLQSNTTIAATVAGSNKW